MSKFNFSQTIKTVQQSVSKHSPEILMAIGITGMISTTVLAVKATPKAIRLLEEKKAEEAAKNADFERLDKKTIVKTAWKCYIPAAVTGTVSVACLIGANSVNAKRNAALATAYKLSETAFSEYKEKVIETIGEKKEQTIKDKVAKEKVEKNPVNNTEIFVTGKGHTRVLDSISGRRFESDYDLIKKAENKLNRKLLTDMYVSLNELYDELEIDHVDIGDELGWNMDQGYITIDLSAQLDTDGVPCLVMSYSIAPRYDFSKLM